MKYVLLDLDGTILDFKASEKEAFKNTIYKFLSIVPSDMLCDKFSLINEELFNEYTKGKYKRIEFQELRFKRITEELGFDINPKEFNEFYLNELKNGSHIYTDTIDILEYLKDKYKLYVVSNGMKNVQIDRLKKANILKYFDDLFISEEIGYNKPDINFFKYVFNKINDYNYKEYIIIGDRIDTDILGGKNASINTIFVNRDNIKYDGTEVNKLIDLKEIL